MKKKFISGNCYLNNLKCFWNIWPWWPWPLTPKSMRLLPNMHVLTKFDEGRSRRSRVIDWNEKVTDGQTDRQSNNIMPSFLWRGHKKNVIWWSLLVVGIVITTRYIYICSKYFTGVGYAIKQTPIHHFWEHFISKMLHERWNFYGMPMF